MFWAYLGLFALGYVFGWLRGFWVGKLRGKLEGKGIVMKQWLATMPNQDACSVCGSPAPMGSVLYRDGYGNKFCPKHWAQLPKERNCLETVSPINPNISNK